MKTLIVLLTCGLLYLFALEAYLKYHKFIVRKRQNGEKNNHSGDRSAGDAEAKVQRD